MNSGVWRGKTALNPSRTIISGRAAKTILEIMVEVGVMTVPDLDPDLLDARIRCDEPRGRLVQPEVPKIGPDRNARLPLESDAEMRLRNAKNPGGCRRAEVGVRVLTLDNRNRPLYKTVTDSAISQCIGDARVELHQRLHASSPAAKVPIHKVREAATSDGDPGRRATARALRQSPPATATGIWQTE